MILADRLPPGWKPDESLRPVIPAPHDFRAFRRLPENPARYAASILGAGVFDIQRNVFLSPSGNGKSARRRFRLNLGRHTKPIRSFYSRIVASLVYGPALGPSYEAHHVNGDVTDDAWKNLKWQTGAQNRAVERDRQAEKRRAGETNGRTKLLRTELATLIAIWDAETAAGLAPDISHKARYLDISERQLQRILSGRSRKEEVAAVRRQIQAERHAATEERHRLPRSTGNPFQDATD